MPQGMQHSVHARNAFPSFPLLITLVLGVGDMISPNLCTLVITGWILDKLPVALTGWVPVS